MTRAVTVSKSSVSAVPAVAAATAGPPPAAEASMTIARLIDLLDFDEPAGKHVREGMTVVQSASALAEALLWPDAIKVMAHALDKPTAVRWAVECVVGVDGNAVSLSDLGRAALDAAGRWAGESTEVNRRAAQAAAERAGFDTPAGCCALAAFLSGGSLAPPGIASIPPAPHLTAATVASAVILAAVVDAPAEAPVRFQRFFNAALRKVRPLASGSPA